MQIINRIYSSFLEHGNWVNNYVRKLMVTGDTAADTIKTILIYNAAFFICWSLDSAVGKHVFVIVVTKVRTWVCKTEGEVGAVTLV